VLLLKLNQTLREKEHYLFHQFSAKEANERENQLYHDRVFDEVLMYNNVQTHYLPVKDKDGKKHEKGLDVLMALEIFELAMLKRYDVVVLIAGDSDLVPLVRKLHSLGCKTMLLGWDLEYTDELSGELRFTKTSNDLWHAVTYPVDMRELVEEGLKSDDEVVQEMFVFVAPKDPNDLSTQDREPKMEINTDERQTGTIMELKTGRGYGFIKFPGNNVFFLATDLDGDLRFEDLNEGDTLEFELYINEKGKQQARNIVRVAVTKELV
jgi:uncharacterized LabA/DUF88 family protein/cold shock CspA family protein